MGYTLEVSSQKYGQNRPFLAEAKSKALAEMIRTVCGTWGGFLAVQITVKPANSNVVFSLGSGPLGPLQHTPGPRPGSVR